MNAIELSNLAVILGVGAGILAFVVLVLSALWRAANGPSEKERQKQIEDMARAMMIAKQKEEAIRRHR